MPANIVLKWNLFYVFLFLAACLNDKNCETDVFNLKVHYQDRLKSGCFFWVRPLLFLVDFHADGHSMNIFFFPGMQFVQACGLLKVSGRAGFQC
jgi:hypothetical protein